MPIDVQARTWDGCHCCGSEKLFPFTQYPQSVPADKWYFCDNCGTVFRLETEEREYARGVEDYEREDDPAFQKTAMKVAEWLGPSKNRSVIEIGFGTGWMMKTWRSKLDYLLIAGVERATSDAERMAAEGFDARRLDFCEDPIPREWYWTFDYAVMWEVLEHVADLQTWFQRTAKLLRPGGRMLARYCDFAALWKSGKPLAHSEFRYPALAGLVPLVLVAGLKIVTTTARYIVAEKS